MTSIERNKSLTQVQMESKDYIKGLNRQIESMDCIDGLYRQTESNMEPKLSISLSVCFPDLNY